MKENDFPGTFIVIEGPDASGKQTQANRITKWLRDSSYPDISPEKEKEIVEKMPGNYPSPEEDSKVEDNVGRGVWRLSFPTYSQTPGGRVVDAYLKGRLGERDDLEPMDIVAIYAADRKQFKLLIAEYLSHGGIIVCDRYREANLVHQLIDVEEEEWENKLKEIKKVDEDLPDADQVFYLDISPEEAIRRMSEKEKDIHEEDNEYMHRSNRNGRKVAKHEEWQMIDAEGTRKEVEEVLKEKIEHIL